MSSRPAGDFGCRQRIQQVNPIRISFSGNVIRYGYDIDTSDVPLLW